MKNNQALNKKIGPILDIISPSAVGVAVYVMVFIAVAVDNQIAPYKNAILDLKVSDFQGTFLYGSVVDLSRFTRLQIASDITLYIFWIIVGIIIFLIASRVASDNREVAKDISMRHYIWPPGSDVNQPLKKFAERLAFHTALAMVIIIYIFKGLPLLHGWWQHEQTDLMFTIESLRTNALLLIYETLFLHGLVVLLRMFFVRRRLFSNS